MADALNDSGQEKKEDADKKKNILEEKSKEELIKLVKKYLNLLQKSKNKTDELGKKCLVLEQEKTSAIQAHKSSEKELLNKIETLQQNISELQEERLSSQTNQGIDDLKIKLKEAQDDKNRCASSLRENEEQVQCLNMQLQSLKASCQCIQEENHKLQKLHEEKLEEINSLSIAKDALLLDFNKKVEEYDTLLNVKNNIEQKCEKEYQFLQSKLEILESENEKLKLQLPDKDLAQFFRENVELKNTIKDLKKQIEDLSKTGISKSETLKESKTDDSDKTASETVDMPTLKSSNTELEQENQLLKEQSENMKSELDKCYLKIQKLEEETKKLASICDIGDYKMGIELALLQGATTEGLIYPNEQLNAKNDISLPETSNLHEERGERIENDDMFSIQDTAGLEYALLQGADSSKLIVECNESPNNLQCSQTSDNEFVSTLSLLKNQEVSSYKSLLEEKMIEIEKLRKNLMEYSSLYSETQDENQYLQKQLQELKDQICVLERKELVTEKTNPHFESLKRAEKSMRKEGETECLVSGSLPQKESMELYNNLCSKIISLYETFQSRENFISKHNISQDDPVLVLQHIQDMYIEIISDLDKKCSELNEYNWQLELLITGIKQGVRQKTSATSYQTENNFEENMNLLKILLDELIMRSNSYSSKLKNLESTAVADKKKMEDELLQLKELKQFLEDENRELNNELDKFKCNQSDIENFNNDRYFGDVYQQSPELYDIEESNESDDRPDTNANLISNDEESRTLDISIQTFHSVKDSSVQVETDLFSLHNDVKNTEVTVKTSMLVQTDSDEANHKIDDLKSENESLKRLVVEKSNLVESIHCQMDCLLTKVEELSDELKIKEDDLKQAHSLNADLKRMLTEGQNIKQQQNDALIVSQKLVHEFKMKNANLNDDVRSIILNYQELIGNMSNNIINAIIENCKNINYLEEICIHKEKNLNIKEWILDFTKDFECWCNFMDHCLKISDETSELDMSSLEKFNKASSENFSRTEAVCDKNTCCLILENIGHLNSYKLKLFSSFYNYLNNNHNTVIKSLYNYKVNVIPNIEKNLAELEKKVADCTCQAKALKISTEDVQEKNSEECLKNTLAETEIKMNKFKQIAVKLKKELAQTKDQYNDVSAEKEKLQKQNSKLLEDISKISGDQCKYMQNYQTLQNEFDKLQDDCEMYKRKAKQLEDDLSSKIHDLTLMKEQIIELESHLKSSKQLLETSVGIKKELDIKVADLEGRIIVLESKISEKEQKISSMAADIAKHVKDLNAAWEDNKNLKNQLELAQKEGNKKSLLDLEMADYERSITELNNKIQRKEDEIEELQKELKSLKERYDCLLEEIKSTETLKETEAKRAESLKEILDKTKSELNKVKEHEAELLTKTASFEDQFETMTQQEEDYKLRLSENLAQVQHLQDVIKTSSENHQRIARSFEQKILNQKEEILLAHKEVESVKQEFENYKIRVHSVLKQQKTATPAITTVDADLKEKLETINEKLKLQVKDLSEKQTALSLEYKALQEEHESLLLRYNKVTDEREQKDKEWQQRLELVNAEKSRLRATQEELSSQHLLQNEMLVATYKKQIKIMSEEHKRIVNDLQNQLDAADVEIARLQRDQQKLQGLPVTPLPQDSSASFDILSQERQEGEGSESTDETTTPIRHLSLATIPSSGFLSFEKLIQTPLEPGTPSSYISNADSEKLSSDLSTANKKIDHLSELLNDSESTNLRLSEQVRVLKDEVRRLENNTERQQHAENLEYLKNVFIKFSSLQPGSEKAMLVPVLTTMLKLNSNEQQQLKSVAGELESGDNANSGWGSYLHRWSGLS